MNPKYSVGDVFCYGGTQDITKILYIHSEFYHETGKSSEPYYCITSFYAGRPPNHMSESNIYKYLTKIPNYQNHHPNQ